MIKTASIKAKTDSSTVLFNVFCDETRIENNDSKNMVIGATFIPRLQSRRISNDIKKLFLKYSFKRELKWSKIDKNYSALYYKIIEYFIHEASINFRCIIVNKGNIKYEVYHDNDKELAFFKFYYLMLKRKLLDNNSYYIFLDRKPTRDKNRARALKSYLNSYILLNRSKCNIKHLQAYSSRENLNLQLNDFLTGLIGYSANLSTADRGSIKYNLVSFFKSKIGIKDLNRTTPLFESKFNIFVWKANEN